MSIDPVDLFHNQYGEGPPLVILHGLLGASGNWHTLGSNVFADHFTVYAVDLRNHGRSPHGEPFDLPAMKADLGHFFPEHDIQEAGVIGHSMGGKVAMHFALSHPDLVSRLVVVDIAPKAYPPAHSSILEALEAVDFSQVKSREDVDDQLAARIESGPVRQFLMKNLTRDSGTGRYSWQMGLSIIHRNYDRVNEAVENGRTYEGPTLVVRGGRSDYVRDEDVDGIRTLFPNAQVETLDGAGHWVHADAPDAFAKIVLDFLRS